MPQHDILLGLNEYSMEDLGLIVGMRGCPFRCSYCATLRSGKPVRYHSVDRLIDFIQRLKNSAGTRYITFKDDCFTLDRERVLEFCNQITTTHPDVFWECNTRIDLLDEQIMQTLRRSNCVCVRTGIESGSEKMMAVLNRKIEVKQVEAMAKLIKRVGMFWVAYIMIGLPHEAEKDIADTMRLIRSIRPDFISVSVYELYPGTELFHRGMDEGWCVSEIGASEIFSATPDRYYLKDLKRSYLKVGEKRFFLIERRVKRECKFRNLNPANVLKMLRLKYISYRLNREAFFSDFRRFFYFLAG
jgi:radical SAM superfamily enzyme YgiQ (UPF0313 family)